MLTTIWVKKFWRKLVSKSAKDYQAERAKLKAEITQLKKWTKALLNASKLGVDGIPKVLEIGEKLVLSFRRDE
jgi:hypothetical protein